MNYKNILVLLLSFTTLLFSQLEPQDTHIPDEEEYIPPKHVCYTFKKEDFLQTLKTPEDIFLMMFDLESGPEAMRFSSTSNQKVTYSSYSSFYCSDSTEKKSECTTEKSIEKIALYKKDDNMYLHVDYLQLYGDLEPVIHTVKSKDNSFAKGVKTPCFVSSDATISLEGVKKGSREEQLFRSIDVKDVSIYDLAYLDDLVIAVGEDSSPQTQELQSQDEYHEAVLLVSNNGGKNWTRVEGGGEDSIPNDQILIFDDKNIVISASIEGAGGTLLHSSDAGKTWRETYGGGMINSLKKVEKEIIATDIVETTITSKDGGATWIETPRKEEVLPQESIENSKKTKGDTPRNTDHLAALNTPQYYIDYEKNTITLRHSKERCHCDDFSLPLTYNQGNTRKGLLGYYWSLGIESHVTVQGKDALLLYDAYSGKESRYIRDKSTKDTFRYNGRVIEKTKEGYSLKCSASKQYFNSDGDLIKVAYPEKSYSIHYKDKKIDTVKEHKNGKSSPYLSFSYQYEGVLVTYEYTKEKKVVTFLKNKNGLLSDILEGKHHFYKYLYDEPSEKVAKLSEVIDVQKDYRESTLYDFVYPNENKTIVIDNSERGDGVIKEKSYLFYSKGSEHICLVNTLRKTFYDNELSQAYNDTDIYEFTYVDKSRKKLAFTTFDQESYGFDDNSRVNFHSKNDRNISLTYSPFAKISHSTVTHDGKEKHYTYTYTKDDLHHLRTIDSPEGSLEILYDKKAQIKDMIIDTHHLQYEYNKLGKPIKITLVGKGKVLVSYLPNGDIDEVQTIPLNDTIKEHTISIQVTRAMSVLLDRVSKGSIKTYPSWIR